MKIEKETPATWKTFLLGFHHKTDKANVNRRYLFHVFHAKIIFHARGHFH